MRTPPRAVAQPPTSMSRRMFLVAAGAAALAACATDEATSSTTPPAGDTTGPADTVGASGGFNPLWIPPLLEGPTFDLALAPSSATLLDGATATTISYEGAPMWGPPC